jgi:alcohol dehydrogenase (cytochrome c)
MTKVGLIDSVSRRPWRLACAAVAGVSLLAASALAAGPSADDLKKDGLTPDNVVTYGMGYGQQRYSTLDKINKGNVKRLVPVWNLSLDNSANASTQPLVIDGVMYVATHSATIAIDALSGKQKWKSPVELPADVNGYLCCGIHSRGLAAQDGVLYRTTIDAHVMAVDMASGKTLWKSKAAEYKEGYSMTHAPLIANGVLVTGISGGEYGTRGFLDGWDLKTGKNLWHYFTVPAPDQAGGETWADKEVYKHGGATTWLTGSYDPDLDLVYWGTGNGGPWNAAFRGKDTVGVCTVLAMRPKTGEVVWSYQFTPGDPYDYDGTNELVHADLNVGGKMTKVIMQANRNGFFYVLDRTNGKLIAANQFAKKVNWASGIDMNTGRPIETQMTRDVRANMVMKDFVDVWPSAFGGKNWMPMSYSPKTKLAYANTLNMGYKYKAIKPEYKMGSWYLGIDIGGWAEPDDGNRGSLAAIDPLTGKRVWDVPTKIPFWAGVLSTAGDLVFTGAQTGEFLAYDANNGKKLWQFQTGSGIPGLPITWSHKGVQYVTVTSGSATLYGALGGDPGLAQVPAGGSVWTFALLKN